MFKSIQAKARDLPFLYSCFDHLNLFRVSIFEFRISVSRGKWVKYKAPSWDSKLAYLGAELSRHGTSEAVVHPPSGLYHTSRSPGLMPISSLFPALSSSTYTEGRTGE